MRTIETERLLLRPFTLDDVEASYQMNSDPEVTRYTNDGGVKTREQIRHLIKDHVLSDYQKHGFGRFAVVLKEENRFIGFSGLKYLPDLDEVDIGYRFLRAYWGQGFATESARVSMKFGFEELNLEELDFEDDESSFLSSSRDDLDFEE